MVTDAEFAPRLVADVGVPPRQQLSQTIEQLLQSLLELGICASDVQSSAVEGGANGPASDYPGGLLGLKVAQTVEQLEVLYSQPQLVEGVSIPLDVINHVDAGKNPHTFTRQLIERVSGENMYTNGILHALGDYSTLLNQQLSEAFPELADHLATTQAAQQPAPTANGIHTNGNGHGNGHALDVVEEEESDGVKMEE